jgi:hypothetical protein
MAQLELCFVSSDSVSDTTLKSGNVGSKLCSELKGPDLEYSTVDKRTRLKKKCFFCGWEYQGGPDIIRNHLLTSEKRSVKACIPRVEIARYKEVCATLQQRKQDSKRQEDNKIKAQNNTVEITSVFNMKPTAVEVTEQWMRAIVQKGLPLDLVDSPEFRAAVLMTARAGQGYVDSQKNESKLPHRTTMTSKVLPALDEMLDAKVSESIKGLITETGGLIISDGWTDVAGHPIVNALLATPAGIKFIKAVDTSGSTKDKEYIANFIIDVIQTQSPENIVAVCMDGACRYSFPLIKKEFPHVFGFICPTHAIDLFLANVCSNNGIITMPGIEGEFEWGSSVFSQPIEDAREVIKFITRHGKPTSIFSDICINPNTWSDAEEPQPNFTRLVKYCETRFASNLLMLQRYEALQIVIKSLVASNLYITWLRGQDKEKKEKGKAITLIVQNDDHWNAVSLTVRVLNPVVKLLRLTDGKTGATLGKVFGLCAEVAANFKKEIPGLSKEETEMIHQLFSARWLYFHTNVFTAAMFLDSEFITDKHSPEEEGEFREVLSQMAETPNILHTLDDMTVEWASLKTAIATKGFGMNNKSAFTERACKMAPFEWARTYLYHWPAIQWVAIRLSALSCSASGCEHSWSIEGWMHSKKRNRLGQSKVQRLVRTHSNLRLETSLQGWKANVLPWEIDMEIEERDSGEDSEESED